MRGLRRRGREGSHVSALTISPLVLIFTISVRVFSLVRSLSAAVCLTLCALLVPLTGLCTCSCLCPARTSAGYVTTVCASCAVTVRLLCSSGPALGRG